MVNSENNALTNVRLYLTLNKYYEINMRMAIYLKVFIFTNSVSSIEYRYLFRCDLYLV